MKALIRLSYNGSLFSGWQYQPGRTTVQSVLTSACESLFGFACDVTGSSRTDAGVHALGFAACISKKGESSLPTSVPYGKIPDALNFYLPQGVSVFSAEPVPDDFHPRYSAHSKTYHYLISASHFRSPLLEERAYIPRHDLDSGAVLRMNEAASAFCGEHDFASYMSSGSSVTDTVRTVYSCSVEQNDGLIVISVTGNGFLYNMVRIIAGTILECGFGSIGPEDIKGITDSRDRSKAGPTLPPYALYLGSVSYPDL
ncbi:MAG: tRNA pseudouridine(38-40) synthase TruA [Clostridia bacterium]|nr:tRNA pseudouridine(38-40) synthase TruA [Clostridia bacterium]